MAKNNSINPKQLQEDFSAAIDRLSAFNATGLEPAKVAEMAIAEKEGRLKILPCKEGDTIYLIEEDFTIGGFTVVPTRFTLMYLQHIEWGKAYLDPNKAQKVCDGKNKKK